MGLYSPLSSKPLYEHLDLEGLYHITSVRLSTGMLALALVVQSDILEMVILCTSWYRCAWLGRWPRRDAVVFG